MDPNVKGPESGTRSTKNFRPYSFLTLVLAERRLPIKAECPVPTGNVVAAAGLSPLRLEWRWREEMRGEIPGRRCERESPRYSE